MQIVKQETQGSGKQLTEDCIKVMLATASPRAGDLTRIRERLGMDSYKFDRVISDLQSRYIIDVVSTLEGRNIRERLVLTELGESILLGILSAVVELAE